MTSKIVKLSLAMALVTLSGLSLADAAKDRIDPKVHDKMVHGDAPTPQIVEKTDDYGRNTPKAPVDPKVHDKMLHGDSPTPYIVEKTDMSAQASPSRQQIRNDRGGKFENLYIN